MKTWVRGVILVGAGLFAACGGGGDEVSECQTLANTTVAVGQSAECADVGNFFGGTATCRSDGQFDTTGCTGGGSGGTVAEGEACTGTGQGNCESGLECVSLGSQSFCFEPCDPAGSDCGPMEYCLGLDGTVSGGICDVQVGNGGQCFVDEGCMDAGASCVGFTDEIGVCGVQCPATEINRGQGSCPAGDACLPMPTPFVEVQQENSVNVTCTDDSDCDEAAGYDCRELSIGRVCTRDLGICGTPSTFYDGDDTSIEADNVCFTVFENAGGELAYPLGVISQYCGIDGATGDPANATCFDAIDQIDGLGVCIATCEEFATGATLDCGVGSECVTPSVDRALLFAVQRAPAASPVTCDAADLGVRGSCASGELCIEVTAGVFQCAAQVTCDLASGTPDAPCDTTAGFACEDLASGNRCARPSRICVPTP